MWQYETIAKKIEITYYEMKILRFAKIREDYFEKI